VLQAVSAPARDVPASTASTTTTRTRGMWPLVGSLAGVAGFVATILTDIHVPTDLRDAVTGMDVVGQIDQQKAHFSIVAGFIAVALLIAFAAQWRGTVERRYPNSNAARIVTQGITAAAGALMLGYGWKGASAIYHDEGMDHGAYDEMGLFIYYILNDFGSYIGWFGVTVAAGAVAWMSLRERIIPLWIGIFSLIPVVAVIGFTGGTGLPGFPGVVSPIWMAIAFAGLALHGTFAAAQEE
jgi:hypothetical protein